MKHTTNFLITPGRPGTQCLRHLFPLIRHPLVRVGISNWLTSENIAYTVKSQHSVPAEDRCIAEACSSPMILRKTTIEIPRAGANESIW